MTLDTSQIATIPARAARAYDARRTQLAARVDLDLESRADIDRLIGHNPLALIRDNHQNHVAFVSNVLQVSNLAMLAETVPWVYRAYCSRGIEPEYFPVALAAWQEAVRAELDLADAEPILALYQWMIDNHDRALELSGFEPPSELSPDNLQQQRFLAQLLDGDARGALVTARTVLEVGDLGSLYNDLIAPCMVEVGRRWERGELSVAHEHLATATTGRVLASIYCELSPAAPTRGLAVVSAVANEHHEVGARMVADLLELDGWDVDYLGANTPTADLITELERRGAQLLALSVMMGFNLDQLQMVVSSIRERPALKRIKILVGGRLFGQWPDLGDAIEGVDGSAGTANEAVAISRRWAEEEL